MIHEKKPVVQEISRRIAEIFDSASRVALPGPYRSEAEALLSNLQTWQKSSDWTVVSHAFMWKGVAQAILGERQEAMDAVKNAIHYGRQDVLVYLNAALVYRYFGYISDSYDLLKRAFDLSPTDPELIELLIRIAFESGRFREAVAWIDTWRRLSPDKEQKYRSIVQGAVELMAGLDIQEDMVAQLGNMAFQVVRDNHLVTPGFKPALHGSDINGHPVWLAVDLFVPVGPERIAELNHQLADRMAGATPPVPARLMESVIFGYTAEYLDPAFEELKAPGLNGPG